MAFDDPPPDEDLPTSAAWSPRRRKLMIALVGVLVIALAAVVVARVATRSTPRAAPAPATVTVAPTSGSATTARPTDTRPPDLTKPLDVLNGLHQLSRRAISIAHASCPRLAPTCTTTGETPSAVVAALHDVYPSARHLVAVSDIAYSDTSGPRLTYRLLTAHAGRRVIVIEMRETQSGDGAGSQQINEGNAIAYRTQTLVDGLTVELQISVPPHTYLDLGPMRRLVDDPALRAIG